jgi:hypothetical protein
MFDTPRAKPKPSPEVLRAHLGSVSKRIDEIDLALAAGAHGERAQELRSERAIHIDTRSDIERELNPPKGM